MDPVFGTWVSNVFQNCIQHGILLLEFFLMYLEIRIDTWISQCLHVKTMLASRCVSFYETIKASSKLCIRFLSNLWKNYLNTVLGRNLFSIANDCSGNPSDLSKMLVEKQMKYFDVPLEYAWKVLVLQELLNTRMNNLYVEGFDDYVITEMINMLFSE